MDNVSIVFQGAVNQVRTLADGGIRVMLDLPEDAIPQMAMLAECKRQGIYLKFSCTAENIVKQQETSNDIQAGRKRKSKWATD
jgi:hypothetical protein